MEINPATIDQVKRAKDGRMVQIDDDVANVARDLREIDPHLRLRYSEAGEAFIVYFKRDQDEEGDGYLVLSATECDQRIVKRVREIASEGYDYAAELDRIDREAKRKQEHAFEEKIGEQGERLAHAVGKDLGHKPKIYVPGEKK